MDASEIKKRFDGKHNRGSLTFSAIGASSKNERISLFLEAATPSGNQTMKAEYQLTAEQAIYLGRELLDAGTRIEDLGSSSFEIS